MELAVEIITKEKTVRSNTEQDLIIFNSRNLATQVRKGEQSVSMMLAFLKALGLKVDDLEK